ncbi:hypothetical protein GOODEAATRI_017264 [Goodea atripinnis]|uniref:Uncharacterized protein n=1 Tax=Goodea atripinnis TaxID=208336 RepID=A0ABV0N2G8_9TELE
MVANFKWKIFQQTLSSRHSSIKARRRTTNGGHVSFSHLCRGAMKLLQLPQASLAASQIHAPPTGAINICSLLQRETKTKNHCTEKVDLRDYVSYITQLQSELPA